VEFPLKKTRQLEDLLFFDPSLEVIGDVDLPISSLAIDSRLVNPGCLFFARKGLSFDGSDFAVEAVRRGALAIASTQFIETLPPNITQLVYPDIEALIGRIAHRFYKAPSEKMSVIGITGTSGKTTLSFILEQLLESMGKKTGLMGTVGIKVAGALKPSSLTTADAIYTHAALHEMHEAGCTHAVLEVSSHALEQKRTEAVAFKAAVFTNLSPEHLDYHKNMESYAKAKSKLFQQESRAHRTGVLGKELDGKTKQIEKSSTCLIANADDPYSITICPHPTLTYGIDKGDVRAGHIELSEKGALFDLSFPKRFENNADLTDQKSNRSGLESVSVEEARYVTRRIQTPLLGLFNVYNLLAAIATLLDLGFNFDSFAHALERLVPPPGRLERIKSPLGFEVLIDYAHKPDALEKALETAKSLYKGKVLLVFGCGGQRDREKRPVMGSIAQRLADQTWITNDNPRNEEPSEIAKEIVSGFIGAEGYALELDRKQAITCALQAAKQGDCVLIAGRGHEKEQIIGDLKVPFNDADVVRAILAQTPARRS